MLIIRIKRHLRVWQTAVLFGLGLKPVLAKMDLLIPDEKVCMGVVWPSAKAAGIRMKAVCVPHDLDPGVQTKPIDSEPLCWRIKL